jgi:hypothetical protein
MVAGLMVVEIMQRLRLEAVAQDITVVEVLVTLAHQTMAVLEAVAQVIWVQQHQPQIQ